MDGKRTGHDTWMQWDGMDGWMTISLVHILVIVIHREREREREEYTHVHTDVPIIVNAGLIPSTLDHVHACLVLRLSWELLEGRNGETVEGLGLSTLVLEYCRYRLRLSLTHCDEPSK